MHLHYQQQWLQVWQPAAADSTVAAEPAGDEGSVLNVQVWNEEFISRVTDHYPGYEKIDATTGKIGDVTVKFTITATKDKMHCFRRTRTQQLMTR